jgi:hypothetical protein
MSIKRLPLGSFRHICALFVLGLARLTIGCGEADTTEETRSDDASYIQDGKRELGRFAVGQVGIKPTDEGGICTGTLIHKNWVVTTAHCKVRDAFLTGSGPGQLKQHKLGRSKTGPNGLTMLELVEPITYIEPVDYHAKPPTPNQKCQSVGFGFHNNPDGSQTLGTKYSATTIVADIDTSAIMVRPGTGSPAGGDSGGPLLCDGKITGFAEGGGAQFSGGGIYHRIDPDWIDRTIANPDAPKPREEDSDPPAPAIQLLNEAKLLGSSGALCPEGTVEVGSEGNIFISPQTAGPLTKDTTQRCKIELSISVPAGLKPEQLAFAARAQTQNAVLPTPASFTVSTPGAKSGRAEVQVGPLGRFLEASVGGSQLACSSQATELRVGLELVARVPRGEVLMFENISLEPVELAGSKCAGR